MKPELDTKEVKVKVRNLTVGNKKYVYNEANNEIYTLENYETAKDNNTMLSAVGRFKGKNIEWLEPVR
jgi:hypothetical protein